MRTVSAEAVTGISAKASPKVRERPIIAIAPDMNPASGGNPAAGSVGPEPAGFNRLAAPAASWNYVIMKAPKPPRDSLLAVEDMTERQAKREHARLEAEIKAHDEAYYQKDAPTVSDAEYDALRRRYNDIEARFPELRTLDSLSRKVGAAPARGFAKVRHAVPMLSLDNDFSEQDVVDFVGRIRRFLNLKAEDEIGFTAEPKIDGLSMSLRYEDGELISAATRGDGAEGEDVTANVKTVKDVPKELKGKGVPKICEVRGEIYMNKAAFLDLSKKQAEAGK